MPILSQLALLGTQVAAAARLDTHLAVTAGAGSGKTRALVGRYLHWVEQGVPVRALIAITFTEKAAREMRSRIRRELEQWLTFFTLPAGEGPGVRESTGVWQRAYTDLDAARIGTIHALCADLLRLYPVEADVDPRFTVLEEGRAALLLEEAIAHALTWAVNETDVVTLFAAFKENTVREMLGALLKKRLDAAPSFLPPDEILPRWEAALRAWLAATTAAPAWQAALATLGEYHSPKADDKLELARRAVLAQWQAFHTAPDWDAAFTALRAVRKSISTGGQQKNWDAAALETVREAMKTLRDDYDTRLKPLLKDEARWALDQRAATLLTPLRRLFERALHEYQTLKDQTLALDFDDLEDRAVRLLTHPTAPLERGDLGVRALLVDEFQDTNDRQRQIVYALAGLSSLPVEDGSGVRESANLFIVGDAKQSIYRFRGADVTVFRNLQHDIVRLGGEQLELNLTFRAHQPLLEALEQWLRPVMGESAAAHHIPFAPLTAHRPQPRPLVCAPYIELQLGLGEDAATGREAAAQALAARLHEIHNTEGLAWGEMALLFRASSAFPIYEDALEAAQIPYVTIAGQGFYNRPEIRDLLNALAAIADPSDDLALAGLLRSPAFALTDEDLYHLRFPNGASTPAPLYPSLISNSLFASAANLLTHLHSLAGRLPIAELLKHLLDATHYRALLKASGAARLQRNVDKLLADAHRSQLVSVAEFLEYVQALRDVGAREGEAPADTVTGVGGGAVQLLTIHKAKGLEFPLVVLADAGHKFGGGPDAAVQWSEALGVLLNLKEPDTHTLMWSLAAQAEDDRAEAETARLLYVAATRAQEKLIVNGHTKLSKAGQLQLDGWLKQLGALMSLDEVIFAAPPTTPQTLSLAPAWAATLTATLHPSAPETESRTPIEVIVEAPPATALGPLAASLIPPPASPSAEIPDRLWRVLAEAQHVPAWVVGKLTHAALRRWVFDEVETLLRPAALEAGLTEAPAIAAALREARHLLQRFRAHPLFEEMAHATEKHHELPYVFGADVGVIDVLYLTDTGWHLADFKTDEVRTGTLPPAQLVEYENQLRRYVIAVTAQLHLAAPPTAHLIFLNWHKAIHLHPLDIYE